MKTINSVILTILILFVSNGMVFSQTGSNVTTEIDISATVISTITVNKVSNIDFGEIPASTPVTIESNSGDAGQLDISSSQTNTAFTVEWTVTPMEHTSLSDILDLTLDVVGSETQGDSSTLFPLVDGKTYHTSPATIDRLETIYIGATVNPTASQTGGEYNSKVTFTIQTII